MNPNPDKTLNLRNPNPPTIIPWKCLQNGTNGLDLTKTPPQNIQKQTRTFAQALSNLCDIPTSQLPQSVLKGDNNFAIPIPEEEYVVSIEACKHNLHVRVIWP